MLFREFLAYSRDFVWISRFFSRFSKILIKVFHSSRTPSSLHLGARLLAALAGRVGSEGGPIQNS